LAAFGLTSVLALFASAAFAEVEIKAEGENLAGDKIEIIVSGESINGSNLGRPPGLTGMAKLTYGATGEKETVIIEGSEAILNTPSVPPPLGFPISCPIQFFYDSMSRIITINLCDTPPTIGGDFVGCAPPVFGENPVDKVEAELTAEHTVPMP
jgi:hypothetical protein